MSLQEVHPQYADFIQRWVLCRDAHHGQEVVKGKREAYLPPTRGMDLDGMGSDQPGRIRYDAFLSRALFPEVFADTINVLVGIMNRKPPSIELPDVMEDMRDKATILGESLEDVIRKINEQQLITARVGLHLDVPMQEVQIPNALPMLSLFNAEAVINWDDGEALDPTRQMLNLVVLDASESVRNGFSWDYIEKYRVLQLGSFDENETTGVYQNGIFERGENFNEEMMLPALLRGQTLDEIPFVFIGPKDINIMPDLPPLLGLANRSFAIYRGEADIRQSLHLTAEDTLVTIGQPLNEEGSLRIGTGSRIAMAEGGDVKFVGPDSRAIQFQENNLKRDYEAASALSARLSQQGSQVESGEALRIRVAAQTANLASIAKAAAGGMQEALRMAARWLGANPEDVVIEPNLNFADDPVPFEELNQMLTFKQRGGVISHRTMSDVMVRRDITTRTLEEELAMIEEEEAIIPESIADLSALTIMNDNGSAFQGEDDESERSGSTDDPEDDQGNDEE